MSSLVDSPPVLVVLSDLHLGAGLLPQTRRWSRLEDFFYDRELAAFIDHLCETYIDNGPGLRLVLNGDCFDFLTVAETPDKQQARELGVRLSRPVRKFGLPYTAGASVWKLDRIVGGHAVAFDALARLLLRGGELVTLPGNHDPELFFPEVQARLAEHLVERARAQDPGCDQQALRARLHCEAWFWHEPGRVFIEHGHQYDETNVVSHLLHPLVPGTRGEPEIDVPLGSFFVRFLHNGLKRKNPYMRNFVSLAHYLEFIGSQNIIQSLRQSYRNATFLLRAIAETPLWTGPRTQKMFRKHHEEREALASSSGIGDGLMGLEALWPLEMARTKARLTRKLVFPALRQAGIAGLAVFATIYLWSLTFNLILAVPWLAEGPFAKAGWLALFAVLTFVAVAVSVRTLGRLLRSTTEASFGSLQQTADKVAQLTKVPNICMGHTHLADRARLASGAEYANSGTWTAMQGPWNQIHPRGMQFTYARLDDKGLHLRRWEHPSREEARVDLFEAAPESLLQTLENVADKLTPGGPEDR